jgi:hypothetical protein
VLSNVRIQLSTKQTKKSLASYNYGAILKLGEINKKNKIILVKNLSEDIKKNEVMLFAEKWIEVEIITLSEINQAGKTNTKCFLSYAESRPKKK